MSNDNVVILNNYILGEIPASRVLDNASDVHDGADYVLIVSVHGDKMRASSTSSDPDKMSLVIRSLQAEFLNKDILELI